MTQSNNNRFVHFNTISLIAVILTLSVLVTLATAGEQSSSNPDHEHHHHWPDVRIAFNTLASVFLFALSAARTIISKTTSIAFSPVRFSWRATKWMTLTVWSSVVGFVSIPIVAYILVAIGCGAVIGGCAGFAVELFTTILYSATWGTKAVQSAVDGKEHKDEDAVHDEDGCQPIHGSNNKDDGDENEDGGEDGQMANNAMLELLQQHLADYAKDQSIHHRATPSTSSAAALLEASA